MSLDLIEMYNDELSNISQKVCLFLDDRNKCRVDDRFQIAKMSSA